MMIAQLHQLIEASALEARYYFLNIVKPNCERYQNEPHSLPALYAACTTIYHIVDFISFECEAKSSKKIRDKVIDEFPEFRIIYSLCIAQKHVKVDDKKAHRGMKYSDIKRDQPKVLYTGNGILMVRPGVALLTGGVGFKLYLQDSEVRIMDLVIASKEYFEENLDRLAAHFKNS